MKKLSVISINLKFMRIPIFALSICALIYVLFPLHKIMPEINLSRQTINLMISSNTAFFGSYPTHTEVFSLLKRVPSEKTVINENSVSSVQRTSVPKPTNLHTVLPKINPDAKVQLNNSTQKSIDIQNYLNSSPPFLKENFSVLILHTHTTESYTPSEKYSYIPTDTDRTRDKNFNMVKIGEKIKDILLSEGINVIHDTTINDYPSYNGSYNRSLLCAENAIRNDSSIKMILDIHRDAIEGKNGEKIKYTASIENNTAAKLMLVTGSNLSGLAHDNWEGNLKFAAQLQKHILSVYPDLMRPINFRSQRFNQHISPGAILVEVGTNGNTLDEALAGAEFFARGLADFINSQKK